ncbi:MAG: tripartite tricarboxylate transporter TctB family protein [Clostridia bacterium]|nr:tripartite tricarboxylate transporter TctB family protein [Clostridia bacterium]
MNKDRIVGLVSLLLGAATLIGTYFIKVAKMAVSMGDPGPKVFPTVAGVLLVICGLGLIFKKKTEEKVFMTKEQWLRVLWLFLAFVGYLVLLYVGGFIIATPILLFVMMTMFAGEKKPSILVRVLYSACCTGVIYLLFAVLLKTNVPMGILF